MKQDNYIIELLPINSKITAKKGQMLTEALQDNGIFLRSDCGGEGKCGKCKVVLLSQGDTIQCQEVLACSFQVIKDIQVEIPGRSLDQPYTVHKADVFLPPEFTNRSKDAINRNSSRLGVAVDLGTTTIALYLCDMDHACSIGSLSFKNPQFIHGADIMSRIGSIDKKRANLSYLQSLVINAIENGIKELAEGSNMKIEAMVIVGNPVMIEIFAGIDPSTIGVYPYQPAFFESRVFNAVDLGFSSRNFAIQTLPQLSGFMGGDILAAALATDLLDQPAGTVLIDLGTNGEIMLKGENQVLATSCAIGPAFEGASLSCGMLAMPGAINKVVISSPETNPICNTITNKGGSKNSPLGICGAGVISAIAQFCKHNIILPGGRFNETLSSSAMVKENEGILRYILFPGVDSDSHSVVYINQKDIRSVQLGKAALRSGIDFLLRLECIESPAKVIIAGAFGSHLNPEDMITIGMIPRIVPERIKMVGNAAGTGAIMSLCQKYSHQKIQHLVSKIKVVDLATDKFFNESFVEELRFPDPRDK